MTNRVLLLAGMLSVASCGAEAEDMTACLDALSLDCAPAYEPSYDAIFDNLLSKTCGSASTGNVCHFGSNTQTGLSLSDRGLSYDSLLGLSGSRPRVMPGNPSCSLLVQRLESDDPMFRMPVGRAQLSLGERCAVRRWIADGAKR